MNRILLIIPLILFITIHINGNEKRSQKIHNDSTYQNDKEEISELIRKLYKWEDKNQITIGQTAITDENEVKVIGFDTNKNLEFVDQLRRTNLFSEEFLSNYQRIVETLDKKIKTKEMEWFAGDIPPYVQIPVKVDR